MNCSEAGAGSAESGICQVLSGRSAYLPMICGLAHGLATSLSSLPACRPLATQSWLTAAMNCALPSVVVAIDPTALKVYPILDEDPAVVLGAASIAVELA